MTTKGEHVSESCELFALAVEGEETFWLCDRRTRHPLGEDWKTVDVFWLYPVSDPLPCEVELLPHFDPTDYVFELLKGGQYSKVSRLATLRTDVKATKVKSSGKIFFFVSAEEIQNVESAYSTFSKNEKLLAEAREAEEEKLKEAEEEKLKEATVDTLVESTSAESAKYNKPKKVRKRERSPLHDMNNGMQETRSSYEACSWERFFILHRGGVPILCPEFKDNSYGFRLQKVLNKDFAVFLLFLDREAPVVHVDASDVGVPVLEITELSGEETTEKKTRRVMVLTRAVGSRKGAVGRTAAEISAVPSRKVPRTLAQSEEETKYMMEHFESDSLEKENDSSDDSGDDEIMKRKVRQRKRVKAELTGSESPVTLGVVTHKGRGRPRKDALTSAVNEEQKRVPKVKHNAIVIQKKRKTKEVPESYAPLRTVGVNMYSDVTHTPVSSAEVLAQAYPLVPQLGNTSGLRTTVLPSGVCVTYSPATETKLFPGGVSAPDESFTEGDMLGLLENIKLAQEQASVASF